MKEVSRHVGYVSGSQAVRSLRPVDFLYVLDELSTEELRKEFSPCNEDVDIRIRGKYVPCVFDIYFFEFSVGSLRLRIGLGVA